jgi:hypothetical protein
MLVMRTTIICKEDRERRVMIRLQRSHKNSASSGGGCGVERSPQYFNEDGNCFEIMN